MIIILFIVLFISRGASGWEQWATSGDAPSPRLESCVALSRRLNGTASHAFVFGGRSVDGDVYNDAYLLDLATKTWQKLSTTTTPPAARFSCVASYDDKSNEFIFGFGEGVNGLVFNDVYAASVLAAAAAVSYRTLSSSSASASSSSASSSSSSSIPGPRYGLVGGLTTQRELIISHGFDKKRRHDDSWALSLDLGSWRRLQTMTGDDVHPHARCLSSYAMNNQSNLYMFGGCGSGGYGPCPAWDFYRLETSTATWRRLTSCPPRRNVGAMTALVKSDTILLHGGTSYVYAGDAEAELWTLSGSDGDGGGDWVRLVVNGGEQREGHFLGAYLHPTTGEEEVIMILGKQLSNGKATSEVLVVKAALLTADSDAAHAKSSGVCASFFDMRKLHGVLMLIAWAFILPFGIFFARFTKSSFQYTLSLFPSFLSKKKAFRHLIEKFGWQVADDNSSGSSSEGGRPQDLLAAERLRRSSALCANFEQCFAANQVKVAKVWYNRQKIQGSSQGGGTESGIRDGIPLSPGRSIHLQTFQRLSFLMCSLPFHEEKTRSHIGDSQKQGSGNGNGTTLPPPHAPPLAFDFLHHSELNACVKHWAEQATGPGNFDGSRLSHEYILKHRAPTKSNSLPFYLAVFAYAPRRQHLVVAAGEPSLVLDHCTEILGDGGIERRLTKGDRRAFLKSTANDAARGFVTIAFAQRKLKEEQGFGASFKFMSRPNYNYPAKELTLVGSITIDTVYLHEKAGELARQLLRVAASPPPPTPPLTQVVFFTSNTRETIERKLKQLKISDCVRVVDNELSAAVVGGGEEDDNDDASQQRLRRDLIEALPLTYRIGRLGSDEANNVSNDGGDGGDKEANKEVNGKALVFLLTTASAAAAADAAADADARATSIRKRVSSAKLRIVRQLKLLGHIVCLVDDAASFEVRSEAHVCIQSSSSEQVSVASSARRVSDDIRMSAGVEMRHRRESRLDQRVPPSTTSFKMANEHSLLNVLEARAAINEKTRDAKPVWFRLHTTLQPVGVALTVVAFALAILSIERGHFSSPHAAVGIAIVILCLLQAALGIFRPHITKPLRLIRRVWEYVHRWLGRVLVMLAVAQIFIGLAALAAPVILFILFAIYVVFLIVLYYVLEKRRLDRLDLLKETRTPIGAQLVRMLSPVIQHDDAKATTTTAANATNSSAEMAVVVEDDIDEDVGDDDGSYSYDDDEDDEDSEKPKRDEEKRRKQQKKDEKKKQKEEEKKMSKKEKKQAKKEKKAEKQKVKEAKPLTAEQEWKQYKKIKEQKDEEAKELLRTVSNTREELLRIEREKAARLRAAAEEDPAERLARLERDEAEKERRRAAEERAAKAKEEKERAERERLLREAQSLWIDIGFCSLCDIVNAEEKIRTADGDVIEVCKGCREQYEREHGPVETVSNATPSTKKKKKKQKK